ncbi:hypothetical protein KSP40_PGU016001 [Platanthera guangdongensis]|uniref:Uncharacterized protein n=1 Tax=Platanthera guangdongensis TaxID=2320717 RepID=A0ABR2MZ20_9ASPA
MHPLSPVDAIHFDPSSPNTQNACIPLSPNGKQPSSEDEVHSLADEILEVDKNNCKENASDSKGRQISLFEKETWQRSGGIICDKNLVPDTNFDEASSCNAVIEIGTDVPEQPLYSEIPKVRSGGGEATGSKRWTPARDSLYYPLAHLPDCFIESLSSLT